MFAENMTAEEDTMYESESTSYEHIQICASARNMIAFLELNLIISVTVFIYFMVRRHRNRQFRAKLTGR